jgi:hypothetical protein
MGVAISTVDSAGPRISMQPEKDSQLQYHVHHVPRDPLLIKGSIAYNTDIILCTSQLWGHVV